MDGAGNLCASCSLINFGALFETDLKCFKIGTLEAIGNRKSCPFCRFVIQVVKSVWARWKDEVLKPSVSKGITVWVKTTLWAHYGESSKTCYSNSEKTVTRPHFRYRPSLGTDWVPDNRQKSSYGSPRYTLCELDRVIDSEGLQYFTNDIKQDVRQILHRRRIPTMVDRGLLKTWIGECQMNHTHCGTVQDNQQAQLRSTGRFRVIDVTTNALFSPSEDISYVALSYVWGGILRDKTASERTEWLDSLFDLTLEKDSTGPNTHRPHYRLRVENLPATIQDSINLARLMGWKYIWIDLLCIRQNDAKDKNILVNKMHRIYEQASFTIVAAGGQDANAPLEGLFSPRSPETSAEITFDTKTSILAPSRPALSDLLAQTTWARRGWTFQEDVLSRCCLYFTATEVFYSCRHHLLESRLPYSGEYVGFGYGRFNEWRESYVLETRNLKTAYQHTSQWDDGWKRVGKGPRCLRSTANILGFQGATGVCAALGHKSTAWDPQDICSRSDRFMNGHRFCVREIPPDPDGQSFNEYASFVTEYSTRELSDPSDVVSAMTGILNKFNATSKTQADVEAHAISRDHLEKGLLWMPLGDNSLQRRHPFPSWSWTGWDGTVAYQVADGDESVA
ncbi:hypothetical protein ACHAPQ_008501, partial [Fusarium lateritium]